MFDEFLSPHYTFLAFIATIWKDRDGRQVEKHIKQHRWEHWRESNKNNMLHLNNERRFVLGRAVNEYFINRT